MNVRERVADALAFALAGYALYWVVGIVDPQIYRVSFLLIALVLTFVVYPAAGLAGRILDTGLIAGALIALVWPIFDFDN